MKKTLATLILAFAGTTAFANPAVDAFARCLSDNTSGKDRKTLARWLFVSMGAHPEMRALAALPPAATTDAQRDAGQLFTRLLGEACSEQTRAAVRSVGTIAVQNGFTVLGQLAMQELMTDKDVAAGIAGLEKYVDNAKLTPVLNPK